MELISGIARDVRGFPGTGTINLDLGGRQVRLVQRTDGRLDQDHHNGEDLVLADQQDVRDGDDLIVAGTEEAGIIVGYAYRNITQGFSWRASCKNDAFQGLLTLFLSIGAFWYGFEAGNEIPLFFWIHRITFFALALLFAAGTITYVIIIVERFSAAFRVNRAALETLQGIARNVRPSIDRFGAYLDIDARRVELLSMPRKIVIDDDDEVVIVGQRVGAVLAGMGYRNVTRGVVGRNWTPIGLTWTLLWMGAWLALPTALLWFSGEGMDDFDLVFGRALALVFLTATLVFALDRFFRWRLDLEAWRRVRAGAQ